MVLLIHTFLYFGWSVWRLSFSPRIDLWPFLSFWKRLYIVGSIDPFLSFIIFFCWFDPPTNYFLLGNPLSKALLTAASLEARSILTIGSIKFDPFQSLVRSSLSELDPTYYYVLQHARICLLLGPNTYSNYIYCSAVELYVRSNALAVFDNLHGLMSSL